MGLIGRHWSSVELSGFYWGAVEAIGAQSRIGGAQWGGPWGSVRNVYAPLANYICFFWFKKFKNLKKNHLNLGKEFAVITMRVFKFTKKSHAGDHSEIFNI